MANRFSWIAPGPWGIDLATRAEITSLIVLACIPLVAAISVVFLQEGHVPSKVPTSGISIISATYGENCGGKLGNVSGILKASCNGREKCDYPVHVENLGDPAGGCEKSFVAEYSCLPGNTPLRREIPAEAGLGSVLSLNCSGINIISATYG